MFIETAPIAECAAYLSPLLRLQTENYPLLSDKAAYGKVLESHARTRYTESALDPSNFAYAPRCFRDVHGNAVVFGYGQRDILLYCLKIQLKIKLKIKSKVTCAGTAQICLRCSEQKKCARSKPHSSLDSTEQKRNRNEEINHGSAQLRARYIGCPAHRPPSSHHCS